MSSSKMKKFRLSEILAISFITLIGIFQLLFRDQIAGYVILFLALVLVVYHFFEKD
jgi:hypothetical protein